jgi:catechol 2,3-dioxygenase-like lactoylglutathione lyase family enzyme
MSVDSLDHLVLTVRDVELTLAFYTRVLGMEVVRFGAGRSALAFGVQKINLHESGRELEPKAARPTPGSADVCLLSSTPLAEIQLHLAACQVAVCEGPVQRTGAMGANFVALLP